MKTKKLRRFMGIASAMLFLASQVSFAAPYYESWSSEDMPEAMQEDDEWGRVNEHGLEIEETKEGDVSVIEELTAMVENLKNSIKDSEDVDAYVIQDAISMVLALEDVEGLDDEVINQAEELQQIVTDVNQGTADSSEAVEAADGLIVALENTDLDETGSDDVAQEDAADETPSREDSDRAVEGEDRTPSREETERDRRSSEEEAEDDSILGRLLSNSPLGNLLNREDGEGVLANLRDSDGIFGSGGLVENLGVSLGKMAAPVLSNMGPQGVQAISGLLNLGNMSMNTEGMDIAGAISGLVSGSEAGDGSGGLAANFIGEAAATVLGGGSGMSLQMAALRAVLGVVGQDLQRGLTMGMTADLEEGEELTGEQQATAEAASNIAMTAVGGALQPTMPFNSAPVIEREGEREEGFLGGIMGNDALNNALDLDWWTFWNK